MNEHHLNSPVAVVGVSAIMPDAPDAATFWQNIRDGRYSISDVPPSRWDPELYYDPDPAALDKTYSRIGGWVREHPWDPLKWRLPVPPKVAEQLEIGQQWAVSAARSALVDAGWPDWHVDSERVAVIIGNAIGGDKHYRTSLRIQFPEFSRDLAKAPTFAALPAEVRTAILSEWHEGFLSHELPITEDTMPGELSNVLAGRIANLFDFRGPNFTTDAACASGLAATSAAVQGLVSGEYDAVVTGGVDRNMGVYGFVKFCKIGALSATGTRPFDAGADGFVMGEGAALFVLKRLADAERDGDRVYAVLLGLAGSSDGKGKGITAPNPVGQRLAVERAWVNAGLKPTAASAVEAHGTSTRVGDASELSSLGDVFSGAEPASIALGSVKSNIGHLKAAAGTAGLFKMVMQLHEKQLAPSLHFKDPNPNVDWERTPFRVTTELREWPADPEGARRGGVSAFGFGGTNFHAVLEEYVPGRHRPESAPRSFASADVPREVSSNLDGESAGAAVPKAPLRGAVVLGGRDDADVVDQLERLGADAAAGKVPPRVAPDPAIARSAVRVAIDFADAPDLAAKAGKTVKAFRAGAPAMWKMLRAQGVFVGRGPAPKVAFLYTGQGSQYVNMLEDLRALVPVVAESFDEADRIMTPLLGRSLSSYIFVDQSDPDAVSELQKQLMRTEITQPAVLTTDLALTKLLETYGVRPDMVMGHSLGEYGALVAAGAMSFDAALEAVSARGHEMASLSVGDNGAMAAAFGPLTEIERVVDSVDGNVVIANINSFSQAVIGGATDAVERALAVFQAEGITAARIPVSHAFHTSIVAPASEPLKTALRRLDVHAPALPIVSNVTGDFYPAGADTETMLDLLGQQVASPVQFVRGLETLYDAGARVFVEVGPKKALHGFVEDVLGEHDDVLALFTNHPKNGDVASFNAALCGLWAAGLGYAQAPGAEAPEVEALVSTPPAESAVPSPVPASQTESVSSSPTPPAGAAMSTDQYVELGRVFADALEQGLRVYGRPAPTPDGGPPAAVFEPVVITGAALGLPGVERVFDDENLQRILDGQQFIDTIPHRFRQQMVDLHITRLVKRESGDPTFETIDDEADVVKLAGRHAPLDVVEEFGVDASRDAALDSVTRLAIGAGFDALRDAGLPLVMRYKTTTLGSSLPERWGLPDALRDDTGVIFASAFPGYDSFAEDLGKYFVNRGRREQLLALEAVRARMRDDESAVQEVDRRIAELRHQLEVEPFTFDRRFLFRCLSMGHSQFAEIIGARGPNTQINAACASTTQAVSLAEDWIRAGRCRRVVVVSADDVTTDTLLPWVTSGFLASGAAATDDSVEEAATPFDRRRHGMIVGMGAAAIVVETAEAARERGLQPICEVLGAVTANSAFHGTRLDVNHIAGIMERVVTQAESRGVDRKDIAASTVFVSHETYTPARGGSASAEINALRSTFGPQAESIVITNTKGFTGHAMGAGIEDVVAIKALETGIVPPVPNYKEPDPELGQLNLSQGGAYPVRHALRLAAGFGSQVAMSLLRWTPVPDGLHRSASELGYAYRIVDPAAWQRWLDEITGLPNARLEVVTRRLRVVDDGPPARKTAAPAAVAEAPAESVTAAPAAASAPAPAAATAPAPAAATAVEPVASAGGAPQEVGSAELTDAVVSIVSEMTGYPPDLLDLDLDLEADLGVDTVKQAEVFAAVRERFGVEREESLSLRDFPTLTHVIGWVRDKTAQQTVAPVMTAAKAATPAPSTTSEGPAAPTAAQVAEPSAPAPVAVTTPEAVPSAAGPNTAEVTDAVVSIVSEMTGYPPDLLDLDLDMEADLGVDTVKQAEVFAAVRERFGVERDDSLSLRDFPTVQHVIGWIEAKTAATPGTPPAAEAVPSAAGPTADEVIDAVVSIVAELTGYPSDLLDLDLDLEADLGVDTVKQAEVFAAVRGRFGVERDDSLSLREFPTLRHVVGWIEDKTAAKPGAASSVTPTVTPTVASTVAKTVAPVEAGEAAAPAVVPSAAGPTADEVTEAVVSIVAELTGYPSDLLDLDLDLEADLGVDTVKQAEVFAAVRGRFGVERDDSLSLREFPTLRHVVGWIEDKTAAKPGAALTVASTVAPTVAPVEAGEAAAPAVVPSAAGPTADEVIDAVVSIVAELTGYPSDLLDLDLDLEADLGVDTVKQAEVFAAVRGRFGVERDDSLSLREFPTLRHVVGWIEEKTAIQSAGVATPTAPVTTTTATPTAPATPAVHPMTVVGDLDAVDRMPRRVPVPVLRPALDQCVATGVELGNGVRVVVMRDEGGAADALLTKLADLGVTALPIAPGTPTEKLLETLRAWRSEGEISGVYWLAALDDEGPHASLDLAGWREALRRRVKTLYAAMRVLYDDSAFLVTGTRLGGFHGYDDAGATAPMGGAVTGFAKSYKRERPEALVKAVDVPLDGEAEAVADLLVAETLRDPGCVEVGHAEGRRWGVGLAQRPFPPQDAPEEGAMSLGADSTVLVTGAAGSIVAAITADLARASGATFHLLDLTPEPDPADPDLREYVEDREGFKSTLVTRMRERGERPTPVVIEKELSRFERLAAALTAIDAVRDAGGTVHYRSVDLTDADAVGQVLAEVRGTTERIDLLLHAAGVDISRALPDKEAREYDLVHDVKADGWFNVTHAAGDLPVGATVVFSSVAGRFGNAGQTDYSAANDLLCKVTSSLRRSRPETRALAFDWTAWGGIGMATRGSTPKVMEMAGVEMLPPEAGTAWIRRELTSHGFRGEVVVAGELGLMGGGFHPTGGLDPATVDVRSSALGGEVVRADVLEGLVVRTTLDPKAQPFLNDHRIEGTPVLPGVMGMEAFAEAARLLVPGWFVVGVEDVDFRTPVKFYRDEPRAMTVTARIRPEAGQLVAECRLEAERVLPGSDVPQRTVHFTGSVRLAPEPLPPDEMTPVGRSADASVIAPADVYRLYFHGPAFQVVSEAWRDDGGAAGRLAGHLPADHEPSSTPTLLGPRLEELCFQVAGLWEAGHEGRLALPAHVDRLKVLGEVATGETGEVVAVAHPVAGEPGVFDCEVVDRGGKVLLRLEGYHTVPMPGPLADDVREPLRHVMA